MVTNDHL